MDVWNMSAEQLRVMPPEEWNKLPKHVRRMLAKKIRLGWNIRRLAAKQD